MGQQGRMCLLESTLEGALARGPRGGPGMKAFWRTASTHPQLQWGGVVRRGRLPPKCTDKHA